MNYTANYYNYEIKYDSQTSTVDVTNKKTGRKLTSYEGGKSFIFFIDGRRRKITIRNLLKICFPDCEEFQQDTGKNRLRELPKNALNIELPNGIGNEYVDFLGYRIYNTGCIVNNKTNYRISQNKNVCLSYNNQHIVIMRARLIYSIFCGPLARNEKIIFLDGDNHNCDYRNLGKESFSRIACNRKRNFLDRDGIYEMYNYIHENRNCNMTVNDIMKKYGCSRQSVYHIVEQKRKEEKEKK